MGKPRKGIDYKTCVKCKNQKQVNTHFYSSNSPMFPDGRVAICKQCVQKELNVSDVNTVKSILRQIDRPFIAEEWQKALDSGKEPFGWYLRVISGLKKYRDSTYEDSIEGEVDNSKYKKENEIITDEELYGSPTIEVIRKWGTGFSNKEYYELETTWNDMIRANDINTPQHKTNLELYCSLKVKTKRALEDNELKTFETMNKQFLEVQKNSGFRPIDRKTSDESAGVRNFSTIFEEVERDGFIEPYKIEFYQDIVDKTIMYLANYTRKLLNMEQLIEAPPDAPKQEE